VPGDPARCGAAAAEDDAGRFVGDAHRGFERCACREQRAQHRDHRVAFGIDEHRPAGGATALRLLRGAHLAGEAIDERRQVLSEALRLLPVQRVTRSFVHAEFRRRDGAQGNVLIRTRDQRIAVAPDQQRGRRDRT
jgi:hypothetical protein